jgi:hypothetical protein
MYFEIPRKSDDAIWPMAGKWQKTKVTAALAYSF